MQMKKYILIVAISVLATSLYAQKKETRKVGDFNYISMGISGDVIIRQGTKSELILEGDEETLENIETTVTGGKLKIKSESNSWFNNMTKIKIYITVVDFTGLSVSGSGNVDNEGTLKGDNVDLNVSGSGDIDLTLSATDVDCGISGSGNIHLKGKGKTAALSISGSGKLEADEFEVETMSIRISGSGGAYVYATKEIDSHISGSGTVRYKGEPDKLSNHSSGSGRLRKM
jgi:hypothetical protein